jgi:hypothetical protein
MLQVSSLQGEQGHPGGTKSDRKNVGASGTCSPLFHRNISEFIHIFTNYL